jgi:thioredoxin 1
MNRNIKLILALAIVLACAAWSQTPASSSFAPLEQWKNAVIAGDPSALKALYSSDPAAEIDADGVKTDADGDAKFWTALKARSIKLEIVRETDHPDRHGIIFKAAVDSAAKGQTINITYSASWQKQADQWRISGAERTDAPALKQPADMKKEIYPANADARTEIREAEEKATAGHKRLLLVFGANWCYDCHVLDLAFQRPDFAPVLQAGYEVVHIDLGDDEKKNADLVQQYEIPLNKGIPALAVAESDGKLVVSQKNGEFEDARGLTPEVLLAFLNQWKPESR